MNDSHERTDDMSVMIQNIAKNQDRKSYARVFNHFAPLIKRYYLAKSGGTDTMAEELVQEAMLKVWMKAASFDPTKSSAATWVFTIARNCRIDMFRKQTRMDRILEVEDIWSDEQEDRSIEDVHFDRTAKQLHESMAELSIEQSQVLNKVYMEGLSHSETAEALSLPLGTVKSRVRLAFQKLQTVLPR